MKILLGFRFSIIPLRDLTGQVEAPNAPADESAEGSPPGDLPTMNRGPLAAPCDRQLV